GRLEESGDVLEGVLPGGVHLQRVGVAEARGDLEARLDGGALAAVVGAVVHVGQALGPEGGGGGAPLVPAAVVDDDELGELGTRAQRDLPEGAGVVVGRDQDAGPEAHSATCSAPWWPAKRASRVAALTLPALEREIAGTR